MEPKQLSLELYNSQGDAESLSPDEAPDTERTAAEPKSLDLSGNSALDIKRTMFEAITMQGPTAKTKMMSRTAIQANTCTMRKV